MKKIILLVLFVFLSSAYGKSFDGNYLIEKAKITYHVHFMLKNIEASTAKVKGKGQCQKGKCDFIIATPVKTFVSKDSNIDTKMLLFTKAAEHPMEVVKTSYSGDPLNIKKVDLNISLAGKSKNYKNSSVNITKVGNGFQVKSEIPLKLSDFSIERPSLLGVKIKDVVPVTIDLIWKKN